MRGWDFVSGEAYRSTGPMVFSYSDDAVSKRDFMNISTSEGERQQFNAPGEGGAHLQLAPPAFEVKEPPVE